MGVPQLPLTQAVPLAPDAHSVQPRRPSQCLELDGQDVRHARERLGALQHPRGCPCREWGAGHAEQERGTSQGRVRSRQESVGRSTRFGLVLAARSSRGVRPKFGDASDSRFDFCMLSVLVDGTSRAWFTGVYGDRWKELSLHRIDLGSPQELEMENKKKEERGLKVEKTEALEFRKNESRLSEAPTPEGGRRFWEPRYALLLGSWRRRGRIRRRWSRERRQLPS